MLKRVILRYEDIKDVGDAELRLNWENHYAQRAAKSAGLVEQAKNAITELDHINALANFEANLYCGDYCHCSKSEAVLGAWHDAAYQSGYLKFDSIHDICERSFMTDARFTVGDYLELVGQHSTEPKEFLDEKKSA